MFAPITFDRFDASCRGSLFKDRSWESNGDVAFTEAASNQIGNSFNAGISSFFIVRFASRPNAL
jgi:hypothetical protein